MAENVKFDDTEIASISWDNDKAGFSVGLSQVIDGHPRSWDIPVATIGVVMMPGLGAMVPWFEVRAKDDQVLARVNSLGVHKVMYRYEVED